MSYSVVQIMQKLATNILANNNEKDQSESMEC